MAWLVSVIAAGALSGAAAVARAEGTGAAAQQITSDAISTPALTRAEIRSRMLQRAREDHYRAPSVLLDRFDVFSRGLLTHPRASVRVYRPALSSLPSGILELAGGERRDIHELREVAITGLPRFWVEPDAQGLSMYSVRSGQTFGGSTASLAQSTAQGMSLNITLKDGRRDVVGVVPDINATIRVRTHTGAIRTVPVIDGVYVVPTGERHIYIRGV